MTQGVLNFTVESTNERLTPRAGQIVFGEYLKAIGFDKLCDLYLPQPGSNRGYAPFSFIQPLIMMLHSGGKSLEDIRNITSDKALREVLKIKKIPTADTIGKWLKRHGLKGMYGIEHINRKLLKRYLKRIDEALVLDIDATLMQSYKSTAETTYKMFSGFSPMIGHLNGGYVIHSEFRSGNIPPADHNLSFVQRCIAQLPSSRTIRYLRADSASYQHKLFDYCEDHNIIYTIGAQLDSSVIENIKELTQWEELDEKEGKYHHLKEEVAEFLHTMTEGEHAFRIIVVRKQVTPILPGLEALLSEEEKMAYMQERYSVIASNGDKKEMSAQDVVRFYRKRGDTSENRIKELKSGFNMNHLPSSDFISNAFYFQIGVLAYNLFRLFKETLNQSWQKHTIQTIRYKLYHIAGKVITHARQTILKVNKEFVDILNAIRQKSYQVFIE
jgi:hypothetical protein